MIWGRFAPIWTRSPQRLATRGLTLPLDEFRELDQRRRAAITESEQLRAEQNALSREIAQAAQRRRRYRPSCRQRSRADGRPHRRAGEAVEEVDAQFREMLAGIPNVPHESVPVGKSADDNVVVRRVGEPRAFDFEPKAHWDLGPELGILDFDRAAKITGARFAVYMGLGAKLERALINFMLDTHTREHGYTEVLPPFMVNSASLYGTGQLPKFAEDLFKLENTDYWLIPTAEVPVTNLYRDETLDAEQAADQLLRLHAVLPQRGGLLRPRRARHHPAASVSEGGTGEVHAAGAELRRTRKLTADAEDILRRLGLPFRTVRALHRRHGLRFGQDYDIEVWLPGQNGYKEISSCSNFEAFQARRANIRFKGGKKSGIRAHAEWQRPGGGPHVGRDRRELSAEGWQRGGPGSAAAVSECGSDHGVG